MNEYQAGRTIQKLDFLHVTHRITPKYKARGVSEHSEFSSDS
jgi:hypothetical protein